MGERAFNVLSQLSSNLGTVAAITAQSQAEKDRRQWEAYLESVHDAREDTRAAARYQQDQELLQTRGTQEEALQTSRQTFETGQQEDLIAAREKESSADRSLRSGELSANRLAHITAAGQKALEGIDKQIARLQEKKLLAGDPSNALAGMPGQVDPAALDSLIADWQRKRTAAELFNIEQLRAAGDPYWSKATDEMVAAAIGYGPEEGDVRTAGGGTIGPPKDLAAGAAPASAGAAHAATGQIDRGLIPSASAEPTDGAVPDLVPPPPTEQPKPAPSKAVTQKGTIYDARLSDNAAAEAAGALGKTLASKHGLGPPPKLTALKQLRAELINDEDFAAWASDRGFTPIEYQKILAALGK